MMSDLAETLWREFAVETEEHFEIIEPLLVAAETEQVASGDIAQLFRSFHSVKGLSRSMDMRGMETCAHHAENLLGLVRDGTTQLDLQVVGLLLESVDCLKGQRELAVAERADSPAPQDLLNRLERAFASRAGTPAAPAAHAPAVQAPAPEASPAPSPAAPSIGPDRDMLRFYAEMVEQHLPGIARLATSELSAPAVRDEAAAGLDALLHATDVMGFHGLLNTLQALRALLEVEASDEVKYQAAGLLGQVRSEIELIEREIPANITGPALADRLREALQAEVHAIVEGTLEVLGRFSEGEAQSAETDEGLADEMANLARSACTFFLFLNLTEASRLALMVEDIFTRIANREMYLYRELLAHTREVAVLLHDVAEGMGQWSDLDPKAVDAVLDRFRHALLVGSKGADGTDPVSALKRVLNDYDISSELVEILSAENIQDLIAAVQGGRSNLYEVLAHLEGDEEMTLAFVKWARTEASPITNRTVFLDGATWFEFLVVSDRDMAQVEARIGEIDKGRGNIRVRSCQAKAAGAAPTAPTAASAARRNAAAAQDGKSAAGSTKGGNVLRVRGETIDNLMAQVGEMVTISNMLRAAVKTSNIETATARLREILRSVPNGAEATRWVDSIETALRGAANVEEHLNSAVGRLQDATLELRVVPIDTLFNRFPRLVRDLAQAKGKQVRLETEGAEVRIDKGMVDLLLDPLMHMVRNSIDHGIETPEERQAAGKTAVARVCLRASSRGNRVVIEITDDGKGLDVERIRKKAIERGLVGAAEAARMPARDVVNFIFAPGFSTAEQVSEMSGRGVGMDVVHTNVMRLGGSIQVETEAGAGSTFTMQLPLSAAIQRVLMVEAAGRVLAIPERFLAEIHEAAAEDYQVVRGRPAILLRQTFLPIFRLTELLGFPGASPAAGGNRPIVVLVNGRQRIGIEVDHLHRRQELFVKEIHPQLAAIPGVGGASISGDGQVVLIVDGEDLFRLAEQAPSTHRSTLH